MKSHPSPQHLDAFPSRTCGQNYDVRDRKPLKGCYSGEYFGEFTNTAGSKKSRGLNLLGEFTNTAGSKKTKKT